jgi:hypothetical protein
MLRNIGANAWRAQAVRVQIRDPIDLAVRTGCALRELEHVADGHPVIDLRYRCRTCPDVVARRLTAHRRLADQSAEDVVVIQGDSLQGQFPDSLAQ